jgi:hypothetical protein
MFNIAVVFAAFDQAELLQNRSSFTKAESGDKWTSKGKVQFAHGHFVSILPQRSLLYANIRRELK